MVKRARRGLRDDLRLYVIAVSSLAVAFVCLGAALLALSNLGTLSDELGHSRALTVYLRDGARQGDVDQLRLTLETLPEVEAVELVPAEEARERFLRDAELPEELAGLPVEAFPASLEVSLGRETSPARIRHVASRVASLGAVEDVETYQRWFDQLAALVTTGRGVAAGVALLVLVCVLAVVANTIRLAVASRRREVEVMKLCGATDDFVRGPFLLEGAFQGFAAALLASALLFVAFLALRGQVDATVGTFTGVQLSFLPVGAVLALVLGGTLVGAAGSALALRRYLEV